MSYLDELFSVAGKTALVTGAATGIGRMVATALVKSGARVLIASRKGADCERVAAELNELGEGSSEGFTGDVSTEAGIAALVAEVKARYGGTRLGLQELEGALLEDTEGALWTSAMLERGRVDAAPRLSRVVVAVDPPVTGHGGSDECGIVVVGAVLAVGNPAGCPRAAPQAIQDSFHRGNYRLFTRGATVNA